MPVEYSSQATYTEASRSTNSDDILAYVAIGTAIRRRHHKSARVTDQKGASKLRVGRSSDHTTSSGNSDGDKVLELHLRIGREIRGRGRGG